eukprot:3261138-Rhodomonas_salina.2
MVLPCPRHRPKAYTAVPRLVYAHLPIQCAGFHVGRGTDVRVGGLPVCRTATTQIARIYL